MSVFMLDNYWLLSSWRDKMIRCSMVSPPRLCSCLACHEVLRICQTSHAHSRQSLLLHSNTCSEKKEKKKHSVCTKFFFGTVSIFLFLFNSAVRLSDTPTVSSHRTPTGGVSQQHPHASAVFVTAEQVQNLPVHGSPARLQHL